MNKNLNFKVSAGLKNIIGKELITNNYILGIAFFIVVQSLRLLDFFMFSTLRTEAESYGSLKFDAVLKNSLFSRKASIDCSEHLL